MTTDDRRLFEGLAVPRPPRDLKNDVVARSRRVLAQTRPDSDPWYRLWNNRGLRLGWAVAAATLLLVNIVVGLLRPHPAQPHPFNMMTAVRTLDPEVRSIVELPPIDFRAVARGGPSPRSENAS